MRKSKYIAVVVLAACLGVSCKKETLLTYDINDNIYFKYLTSGQPVDSAAFSFAYSPASVKDSVFKIPFAITGAPANHDRTYSIIVVDSNTTAVAGQHYILPAAFIVHAGRIVDSLPLKLLRAPDLQTKTIQLKLALRESSDFKTNVQAVYGNVAGSVNVVSFRLLLSDQLGPGNYWSGVFAAYFGAFSVKKVRLINQVAGMPLDYYTTGWLTDAQLSARAPLWAIITSRYLSDQKAAGQTVYEDDGVTQMTMGTSYQ
jgi:hypothetical protein